MKGFLSIIKGIGGDYELIRTMGAFGIAAYVVVASLLTVWEFFLTHHFDLIAYSASFPAGLGVAVGAVSGAVALKDRSVATAIQTRDGTSAPVPPPPESKE